jgi:hypothetical protein
MMEKFIKQLQDKKKIFNWLIDYGDRLNIPLSAITVLTKEYICKHYNFELSYFE